MRNKIIFILFLFLICILFLEEVNSDFIDVTSQGISVNHFSEKEWIQTEVDSYYPCSSDGICSSPLTILNKNKMVSKETKLSESDLLHLNSFEMPLRIYNGGSYTEEWISVDKLNSINLLNYFNNGAEKVQLGFNSNVWQVTNFYYGTPYNTSIDTNVTLTNLHTTQNSTKMVGYWQFTKNGQNYAQGTLGSNDGTVSGATHIHELYSFDGINDQITNTIITNVAPTGSFTMSAWVKFNSFVSSAGWDNSIVDVGNSRKIMYLSDTNAFSAQCRMGGTNRVVTSNFTMSTNTWYHVAFNCDNKTGIFAYVNGKVVGIDHFGESAPAGQLFKEFGFTVDNVVKNVEAIL